VHIEASEAPGKPGLLSDAVMRLFEKFACARPGVDLAAPADFTSSEWCQRTGKGREETGRGWWSTSVSAIAFWASVTAPGSLPISPGRHLIFVRAKHSCSNASVSQGAEYPACRSQTLWREAIRLHFHDNLPATLITRCTAKLWAPASAVRKPITRGQRLEDRLHTFETAQPLAGS
jgi:hypothetical protein